MVHCPYCHGWEVQDEPIGVLAAGPASVHQVLLFRQPTGDLVYFSGGTDLTPAPAAGALAGAHMNAHLVTADTDADLAAARGTTAP